THTNSHTHTHTHTHAHTHTHTHTGPWVCAVWDSGGVLFQCDSRGGPGGLFLPLGLRRQLVIVSAKLSAFVTPFPSSRLLWPPLSSSISPLLSSPLLSSPH